MAYNEKTAKRYQMLDKCNPKLVDMGMSIQFADAMPGMNDVCVRPFGWTEYEAAFRHQYVPDPCKRQMPCRDPCRPRRTTRKDAPRQFVDPCATVPRQGLCNLCNQAKCRCNVPPPWAECKEKVVIYDPDSIRSLIVHGELKNEHPVVLSNGDYSKVLASASVKTKEQKEAECLENLRRKQEEIECCRRKADEMRNMDKKSFNASISPEAREQMEEIIGRANSIITEDEPEIRALNQIILAAKVQAIREAQLAEKELIRCEQAEEERRILALIAQTSTPLSLQDDGKSWEEEENKKKVLMASLKGQLDEKEAMKYLEKISMQHEHCELRKIWESQDMEELQLKNSTLEKKHRLGKELLEDQLLHLELKKNMKELDRQEDEQMIEWQKKKDIEQEKLEKQLAAQKQLKEAKTMQVFGVQQKTEQSKLMREDLRNKRYQEQQEREWRQRERDDILKKRQAAAELKESIICQIQQQRDYSIEQAAYDKAMHDKIYSIQNWQFEKEGEKEEEKKIKAAQYKLDLREQIHKYQLDKVQERKDFFVEGINFRRELNRRNKEIRQTMECKLEELKESNLPEKYINYIRKAVEEQLKPDWRKSMGKK